VQPLVEVAYDAAAGGRAELAAEVVGPLLNSYDGLVAANGERLGSGRDGMADVVVSRLVGASGSGTHGSPSRLAPEVGGDRCRWNH
jgi:hypothetical protein